MTGPICATSTRREVCDLAARYGRLLAERVEWEEPGALSRAAGNARALTAGPVADLWWAHGLALLPLYRDPDDGGITGLYVHGAPPADTAMIAGLLDAIADAALEASGDELMIARRLFQGEVSYSGFVRRFGDDGVDAIVAVLHHVLATGERRHVRYEDRAWPVDEYGEAIVGEGEPPLVVASLDSDDDRWLEMGFTVCAPTDEGATLITQFDLACEAMRHLEQLVAERAAAALAALRGQAVAA